MLNKIYAKGMYSITPDEEKAAEWKDVAEGFKKGIDGTWEGSISMGEDIPPMALSYDFTTDGNILTGTTPGFGGRKMQIQDGKIDGNSFSFTVKFGFGGTETINNYRGGFYGDTIKLTYTTTTETSKQRGSSPLKIEETSGGGELPPITFIAKRSES